MANFNATRYDFSKGNLSDGFQGRPDLGIYGQAVKESKNFYSNSDGAMRFRPSFTTSAIGAPKEDSSGGVKGTTRTIAFFADPKGEQINWAVKQWWFLDFCENKSTGRFDTVFLRLEDEGTTSPTSPTPNVQGTTTPNILSNTADGEVTLVSDLDSSFHRIGATIILSTGGTEQYATISEADSSTKDVIKVVKPDGQAFTAMPNLAGEITNILAFKLLGSIGLEFDWTAVENGAYLVDGGTRIKFEADVGLNINELIITQNYTITDNPFPPATAPGVGFNNPKSVELYQNRLLYTGFTYDPTLVVLSALPTTGNTPLYDVFTTGVLATDAMVIYLNPVKLNPVREVKWAAGTNNVLLIGLDAGIVELTSSGPALSPTDVQVGIFSFKDPSSAKPIVFDNFVDWVSVEGDKIYESSFSFNFDAEVSYNLSILTNIRSGVEQILSFTGKEEGFLARLSDGGLLLGLRSGRNSMSFFPLGVSLGGMVTNLYSYSSSSGQRLGVNVTYPAPDNASENDKYLVLEINIEEFFRDEALYLIPEIFPYVGHRNAIVLDFINGARLPYLEDSFTHSASVGGTYFTINASDNASFDVKVSSDTGVTLAGKQILIPELGIVLDYAEEITSGGDFYANYLADATLGGYDLATTPIQLSDSMRGNTYVSFESFSFSKKSIVGATTNVKANGMPGVATPVEEEGDYGFYTVTLDNPAFVAHVGEPYTGMFTLLPLTPSGSGQLGYNRPKSIAEIQINLINSGDGDVYINRNQKESFVFGDVRVFDWKKYHNGVFTIRPESSYAGKTEITFFQNKPQPLNVSFIDIYQETSND